MQHRLTLIIFTSLFFSTFSASGQKLVNSPYSRFNLGTLENTGSFRSLGMGGVGTAMRDNNALYITNPASYSSLDTNSFIFDFGLDYGKISLSDGNVAYSSYDINFNHLLIGFPISKAWGFAAGITPVSNGYYNISESITEGDSSFDPLIGAYSSYHSGSGGFTNFFLGTGIKLNKNFSAGMNLSLLFGKISRINQFEFSDNNSVFNNNSTENLRLGGFTFDYGIQYLAELKNDYFLNAGISFRSGNNYSSTYEHLAYTYAPFVSKDTISYISDNTSKTFIPGTLSLGVSVGKTNKFSAGADYISTNWSGSNIQGTNETFADTRTIRFGFEIIPDRFSNVSALKRIEYRIGGHVGDNYLIIDGEQIKEWGASVGLGLPMKRSWNKTNVFFDFTRKSGTTSLLHTEDYYSVGISLNLYDFWFLKRKYD